MYIEKYIYEYISQDGKLYCINKALANDNKFEFYTTTYNEKTYVCVKVNSTMYQVHILTSSKETFGEVAIGSNPKIDINVSLNKK